MKTIVIALGGNALLNPSGKQSFAMENKNIDNVSKNIAALSKKDFRIIITHGNGSQVGDELIRNEHAKKYIPKLPLHILNAETQALIGSVLETSLRNNLDKNSHRNICVILSHVMVDKNDPAFKKPSKPVGPFYTKKELNEELNLNKFDYMKSSYGYRRVVASPKPQKILEIDSIISEANKNIVITCGGGGIPTIINKGSFIGIDAVIDKDLTTQLLASSMGAETMIILTNTDYVYSDYPNKSRPIKEIKASVIKRVVGKFEEGTIKPKINACISFIENGGKAAYIGNVFKLDLILRGRSGTKIH